MISPFDDSTTWCFTQHWLVLNLIDYQVRVGGSHTLTPACIYLSNPPETNVSISIDSGMQSMTSV